MCFLGEGADVQFPLEVLGEDGAQEAEGLDSVDWGVTQGDGGEWDCILLGLQSPQPSPLS